MVIEDMQQSLELLENIKYFFYNIEEIEKKLNIDLRNKEYERDDLLHEIELSKLNAIEIMAVYKKLEKVLQERRIIKDKIEINVRGNYDYTIGKYKTEERAKEVLQEIVKTYVLTEQYKVEDERTRIKLMMEGVLLYEMPKE